MAVGLTYRSKIANGFDHDATKIKKMPKIEQRIIVSG